ncbi:MAG: hypothetical protein ACI83Y_002888 [Candidatus Azotimanducaceae bacterium]|jgi:predicted transcriptional regulator
MPPNDATWSRVSCCDKCQSLEWRTDTRQLRVIGLNVHVLPDAPQCGPHIEMTHGVPVIVNTPLSHAMQRSGTQSISRTLDVIECFLDVPERGVNEIARLCGLSPSTAHRVVRALVARGYLEQNASRNRYRLGRSAAQFADAVQRHVPA